MNKKLYNYRLIYKKNRLLESNLPKNPLKLFHKWIKNILNINIKNFEVNAMSLATINKKGFVESRIVLLKEYNDNGFIFYTNYNSRKGKAISNNPNVCLSFYWPFLERQVIIKGIASKISKNSSDNYFYKRPRNSQIATWVSKQSNIIPSRSFLEKKFIYWNKFFNNNDIKRPIFWGGYQVKHNSIEFWQGRPNRLHDIIYYELKNNKWTFQRRSP